MRHFLFFIFCLTLSRSRGQNDIGRTIADNLEKSQFYFAGQGHNNEANIIIEKEILFALNSRYNTRYDILEYSHSAAFLVNEYLRTGNDSLLVFINPEANFSFARAVKARNDTVSDEKKIRFYGLDFENRDEGRYTRKAIGMILQQAKLPATEVLTSLLLNCTDPSSKVRSVNLSKLKTYLDENQDKCRLLLGSYFIDVVLITNAQYNFSPNRDKSMITNFNRLFSELVRNGEQPYFFAFFGTGHINPVNSKGIAMQLMNDEESPVRNSVSIIGIQYFNCQFGKERLTKPTYGNLDFLCKKTGEVSLPPTDDSAKKTITFLSKAALTRLNCNKAIGQLSGLVVVNNFGAAKFWAWE